MVKLTNYERETIFNYNEEEKTAVVYTSNKALMRKLSELAKVNDSCKLTVDDSANGSQTFELPKKWIKIRLPKNMSDEQRIAMSERGKLLAAKRKEQSSEK